MKKSKEEWTSLSDLASERARIFPDDAGIKHEKEVHKAYTVERIRIEKESGESVIDRPMGSYQTVSCRPFHALDEKEAKSVTDAICKELHALCAPYVSPGARVLVVGLGNDEIPADSIGTAVCRGLRQTAVIKKEDTSLFDRLGCAEIMLLCPDVEAKTGISAHTLVHAAVRELCPALVLIADALCTRSYERLTATVQLSDTGIFPGSGLGNRKERIAKDTVGVPVIAIGIPTVESAYAFILEEGGRRGMTDFSGCQKRDAYICPVTLCEDIKVGARIVSDAIERALGFNCPKEN